MKLRWSPEAADDFAQIIHHIREENPTAALRVAQRISENIAGLKRFPRLGRPGRVGETRELILSPLPFIVVYRIQDEIVEIARVLHGAQRWP
ncbi:MAG TPA: type II toxin-antitoxin system RelE/ParE family toxin [Candidatus Angelobacter sp.]